MKKPLNLVILAAGLGSRFGGLKQMTPMGPAGETLLDFCIHDALAAGFERIVYVIREDFAEAFQREVGARFADRAEVAYAYQNLADLPEGFAAPANRKRPWGTAHAVWAARHEITGPFAVMNADDFYGADALVQAANFLRNQVEGEVQEGLSCALVGYSLASTLSENGTVNRGRCEVEDGQVTGVVEVVKIASKGEGFAGEDAEGREVLLEADAVVSMNLWAFPQAFVQALSGPFGDFLNRHSGSEKAEFYIPTAVDALMAAGQLRCELLPTTSQWMGVTYPEDVSWVKERLGEVIEQGAYPSPLVGG